MKIVKLLVVDDDQAQRELVAALLGSHGYQVDTACDGEEALRLLRDREYQLAILDYQMPGMDGVELYRRARELRPDLPGIFLTAYTTIDTVFPAIHAGVERVLAKPVNYRELMPLVENLAGKVE
jgi:CheY-like chemotaxis protein